MNKRLKVVVTLLLVLTMLFGVTSMTALAAAESLLSEEEQNPALDTLDTGWCEISYDSHGITVTLNPDVKSLLAVSEEDIRAVVNILIDALKTIVVDDLKSQILGGGSAEPQATYSIRAAKNTSSSDLSSFEGLWTSALDAFIGDKYGSVTADDYLKFMKDILADNTADDPEDTANTTIEDFIKYSCELIKLAVAGGGVSVDQLPEATEELANSVINAFNDKVNEYIDAEVERLLPQYAEDYLSDIVNEGTAGYTPKLEASIKNLIDSVVADYIEAEVNEYIDNGFKIATDSTDPVDSIVGDYTDSQIRTKVNAWIQNYANGELTKNPSTINSLIDNKITGYVQGFVDAYFGEAEPPADNPIYPSMVELADKFKTDEIEKYKNN